MWKILFIILLVVLGIAWTLCGLCLTAIFGFVWYVHMNSIGGYGHWLASVIFMLFLSFSPWIIFLFVVGNRSKDLRKESGLFE